MVGFEGIKGIYPGFRVNPKQDQQQRKSRDEKDQNAQKNKELKEERPNDGKPHIDEFA